MTLYRGGKRRIHAYLLKQFPRQFENFHTFVNDREHVTRYYSTDELVESVNFDTISDCDNYRALARAGAVVALPPVNFETYSLLL